MDKKMKRGPDNLDTDLLVIGGGGAGLAAAVEASEQGVRDVIVIEKRRAFGGTSALGGGIFACESPVQTRLRIEADRDHLFKKAMDWAHWSEVDPNIVRAFVDRSGETIGWLEGKGLEFDLITFYPNQMPPVQHNPRGNGAALVRLLLNECRKNGVRTINHCSARRIIRSSDGRVEGVEVNQNGQTMTISCRSIIIATGGFAGNQELMKRYFPSLGDGLVLSGLPLEGDGIDLAAGVGAAISDRATLLKEGPRFHIHKWPLFALERDPVTLWVNKRGQRFTDESTGYHVFESVNSMMKQPEMVSFTLLDESIRRHFETRGLTLRRRAGASGSGMTVHQELEKGLRNGVRRGTVKIAHDLPELADWIGAERRILKETVADYNECCHRGHDPVFAKERKYLLPLVTPPYYALKGMAVLLDTIGGIRIDDKMRVLDRQGKTIPGIYAAGVITSGWESEIYCSELSASAFGFAINSGRIAAGNAASYLAAPTP